VEVAADIHRVAEQPRRLVGGSAVQDWYSEKGPTRPSEQAGQGAVLRGV
jgi:hypothetical protein